MSLYRYTRRLLILLACALALPSTWAGVAVVAHPSNPVNALSTEAVERLFLGKDKTFPGAGPAVPVDQAEGSHVRRQFLQQVLGKDGNQLKAYWSRLIFTGKGTPPEAVANDAAVKRWLNAHPNGIGYIDDSSVDDSVKVLLKVN